MRELAFTLAAVVGLVLIGVRPAVAQSFTFTPYAGVLVFDDGALDDAAAADGFSISVDPSLIAGLRVGIASESALGFEAGYGYSPGGEVHAEDGENFDLDVTTHVYYAGLVYELAPASTTSFFLSGGVGGITLSADEAVFDEGAEASSTDLMVNVGGGLLWQASERLTIRIDAMDHIGFCRAAEDGDDFSACPLDDKALNHIELSGGITLQLGG